MTVALRPEIRFSPTGVELPPDLSFDEWADYGERLFAMERGVMWAIGDWWRYGEHAYGERAAQALDSHYSFQTLADAGWVSGQITTSRRREVLSWSHHKEVAALPAKEQDYWLDEAEKGEWSRNDLRARIKRGHEEDEPISAIDETPWQALQEVMADLSTLLERDPTTTASAVPDRRRAATARKLRKLGMGLARIAWTLEEIGEERNDESISA